MHVYNLHVLKLHKCTFINVFTRFTQKVTLSTFISRYSIVSGKMEWMTKCNNYDYKQEIARYVLRLAPMSHVATVWHFASLFCSCHGIAGFLVDELQI